MSLQSYFFKDFWKDVGAKNENNPETPKNNLFGVLNTK